MPLDVQGTFVSQKINKIRWIPEEYVETKCFFTGSWDDEINSIKVWSFESLHEDEEVEYPRVLSEYPVDGDVTEIKFIDKNKIAVSISNGEVRLLEISVYEKETPLKEVFSWKQLHNFDGEPCSCTSLDTVEGDIASVGENGALNILNGRRGDITRTIADADSCSLHSVCFFKHNELMSKEIQKRTTNAWSQYRKLRTNPYLQQRKQNFEYEYPLCMDVKVITGNLRGHMKIWDLRSSNNKPAASFLLAGDELAATCIANHPTQPHIILAGSESGSLAVWDLRQNSFPTSLLNAHSAGVTEMQFHPENPHKLLTCSISGELWDWNMESMTKSTKGPDNQLTTWLPFEDKNAMMVNSLMPTLHKPINTLNCDRGRILCGTDNEAVYLIKNFKY